MKRLISYNVFEGDSNLIKENQILVIRDTSNKNKITDIKKRVNGNMVSIITDKVAFIINSTIADSTITINGVSQNVSVVTKGNTVTWSVSKTGYITQSGSEVVVSNTIKDITLIAE